MYRTIIILYEISVKVVRNKQKLSLSSILLDVAQSSTKMRLTSFCKCFK